MKRIKYILPILVLVMFWWILRNSSEYMKLQLPSLISVFEIFTNKSDLFTILEHLYRTFLSTIEAMFYSTIFGYAIGVFMGNISFVKNTFYPLFNALKSIPVTILIPVMLGIFGLTNFIIPLIVIPGIANLAVNMSDSFQHINKERNQSIKLLGIRKDAYFFQIQFFETIEVFFATVRFLFTYILAIEIVLDYYMSVDRGIGYFIYRMYSGSNEQLPSMYASIFLVATLGVIIVSSIDSISKKVIYWKSR